MAQASRVANFEDLRVFQSAKELTIRIYKITKEDPFGRDFALKDQIQRAAVSILSNIAEGFERGTNADFIRFLYISKGSCGEVRAQLIVAKSLQYINQRTFEDLTTLCRSVSSMIWSFINYLKRSPYPGPKF